MPPDAAANTLVPALAAGDRTTEASPLGPRLLAFAREQLKLALGRRTFDRPARRIDDEEAWHIYRRCLRRLHQQHTLLATIQPGLLPPTMGLDAHAGALGALQDAVLLLGRCANHSPFPAAMSPLPRRIAWGRLRKARRGWVVVDHSPCGKQV